MRSFVLLAALCLAPVLQAQTPPRSQGDYAPAMAGISNEGKNQTKPYVTAGDRAYLIGLQNGDFTDLGEHVPGEMGGLWVHPIKLIDGFTAVLTDSAGQNRVLLQSREFINYPYGNRFKYGTVFDDLEVERFQFSPDGHPGVVVQYQLSNSGSRPRQLRFQLGVQTDLLPVWLSEKLGITDAPDTAIWQQATGRFVARDTEHNWFAVWGAATSVPGRQVDDYLLLPVFTKTRGIRVGARYGISIPAHDSLTLTFVFAGSTRSSADAEREFTRIAQNHPALLEQKKAHYAALIDRARIRIPDQRLQQVYDWVRIDAEWLVREVPGIGRGLGAGLMEYPWWFGADGAYSLQALLATGHAELVKQNLRLLRDQSAKFNGNGRIVHEVTTYGALSNPGNTQETAQFILTVGKAVQWTGDVAFAREMYPAMKQGLRWLLTDMDPDRNLFPGGYGITEILGLNAELIDVSVYTQQALLATAGVSAVLGHHDSAKRYRRLASELEQKINDRFWVEEEGSYADFHGTKGQAIGATEGAIKQIRLKGADKLTGRDRELIEHYRRLGVRFAAMPDTTKGWITNKNWVVATPMEMGIAPRERAVAVLDRIRRNDVGEYGPWLSAVERQAMMTISTGVLALAEANYRRMDESLWYMDKIVGTFNRNLPGSISEMMPDYGCFVQAWTMYGIVLPLVQHIFGIQPDAVNRTVVFDPHLPGGWEELSIEDVAVGTNLIAFARAKTGRGIEYHIEARQDGWSFVLKGPRLPGAKYYVNGLPVPFTSSGIRMSGRRNDVLVVP